MLDIYLALVDRRGTKFKDFILRKALVPLNKGSIKPSQAGILSLPGSRGQVHRGDSIRPLMNHR
jgi:hypothetical protein